MTITEQWRYEIYEAKKILLYDQINAEEEEFQNYIFFQKLEMDISQKFASSHVFRNLNFNSFNPSIYGDAFEKNILFELHKKILCERELKCSYCICFRGIKKYKCIEENMHFKYSYRICTILTKLFLWNTFFTK